MPVGRGRRAIGSSLDEFVGEGEERAASPLQLDPRSKDWQTRLAALAKQAKPPAPGDLALSAFTLIRGGDLFERQNARVGRTEPSLLSAFAGGRIHLVANEASAAERDAALAGVLRVLEGNPALCRRMLLAKPIRLVIIPKGHDFRGHGFPGNTNPLAAGIFWNAAKDTEALIGLREELILEKAHLMVHEMTHAVHFLGFTAKEREAIDRMLLPVYRSRRWVEEAVAIYAERAFGAAYTPEELDAPGLYGKTRRDWNERHVFAKFIEELMRPR